HAVCQTGDHPPACWRYDRCIWQRIGSCIQPGPWRYAAGRARSRRCTGRCRTRIRRPTAGMTRFVQTLRGIAALTGVIIATLIGFVPLLPAALIKLLVPWQPIKRPMTHAVLWIARHWLLAINASLMGFSGARIHYDQQLPDNPN